MKNREVKFTSVTGRRFFKNGQFFTSENQNRIDLAIEKLQWKSPKELGQIGFMQGRGLKEIINEHKLDVDKIAISHDLAPYGFYGIRAKYKGGTVDQFYLDTGTNIIPLFHQAEESFFTFHEN